MAETSEDDRVALSQWFAALVMEWRAARTKANGEAAEQGDVSGFAMTAPVQLTAYLVVPDDDAPLALTAAVVSHDPGLSDGMVGLRTLSESELPGFDAGSSAERHALDVLRVRWQNIRRNWFPGRAGTTTSPPSAEMSLGASGATYVWCSEGRLWEIRPSWFSNYCFRPAQLSRPAHAENGPVALAFDAREARERLLTLRWLDRNGGELLRNLGLRGPFWCGLFLPRKLVFGDASLQGDVDLIAGPMPWRMTSEEFERQRRAVARDFPLATPPESIDAFACMRAAAEGLLTWPPPLETLVACEIKASWYEPETGTWKRTHSGDVAGINGQLRLLAERGIERVALLHLGVTKPRPVAGAAGFEAWAAAGADARKAQAAFRGIVPEDSFIGSFSSTIGALAFATEESAGAETELEIMRAPCDNPRSPTSDRGWRDSNRGLRSLFRFVPRATATSVYLTYCVTCDEYRVGGLPSFTDSCSHPADGSSG